jgi:hypothetical protein
VVGTSAITLMELYCGAFKSRHAAGNPARIRAREKGVKIWELGRETAEVFGARPDRPFSQPVCSLVPAPGPVHRPRISRSIRRFAHSHGSSVAVPASMASAPRAISVAHAGSVLGSPGPSRPARISASGVARVQAGHEAGRGKAAAKASRSSMYPASANRRHHCTVSLVHNGTGAIDRVMTLCGSEVQTPAPCARRPCPVSLGHPTDNGGRPCTPQTTRPNPRRHRSLAVS